jgi:hypothetical protein
MLVVQMLIGQTSARQTSIGHMLIGQMLVGQTHVGQKLFHHYITCSFQSKSSYKFNHIIHYYGLKSFFFKGMLNT